MEAEQQGKKQFEAFVRERLTSDATSLHDIIYKNNLCPFRDKNAIVTSNAKENIISLKSDRRLYSNLFIACQSREGDLDSFLAHENHAYPVSLSEYGRLRTRNSKSDFLDCLNNYGDPSEEVPAVDMTVIDGATLLNMNPPFGELRFREYCNELKDKLSIIGRGFTRMDAVFDVYKEGSLKSQTLEKRGTGIRVSVREHAPVLKNFTNLTGRDANKTELFDMISQKSSSLPTPFVVATVSEGVGTNQPSLNSLHNQLSPCTHEEADTRLILHILNGSSCGFKKISIITVDTDVVVILLYHFFSLDLDELWIEFGVGKSK